MPKDELIKITFSESETHGRYGATQEGMRLEAELLTIKVTAELIIVEHMFVPKEARGQGLARVLAQRVISDARAKGQRIVPRCGYFRDYALKHKEDLTDVIEW